MAVPLRHATAGRIDGAEARSASSHFGLVGSSTTLVRAVDIARRVAASPSTTVLIGGETGTGKELFARGIHAHSAATDEPFVAINCSAIPETLLEAELFGHEAGAFTGARTTRPGLAEVARRGTLFLDEIGELPLSLQPKLLRLLEERTVRRLGGSKETTVRCRIIAGTNVQLERAVSLGRFREDLYYRLNVVRLDLPALRERPGDILALAEHFIREFAALRPGMPPRLDRSAVDCLERYRWPGNVRELRNVMERATLLARSATITDADLQLPMCGPLASTDRDLDAVMSIRIPASGKSLAEIEREAIRATMLLTAGNLSAAARILGMSRPTLTRRLRESGVTRRSLLASS
ncbi:MAG: sigma-54 interaction domain-containing protein [Gemmatimonadaceae bacterium]